MTDYESAVPKNPWLSVSSPIPFCISTHNSDHFLPQEGFSNAEIKSRAIPEIVGNAGEYPRHLMLYDIRFFQSYLTIAFVETRLMFDVYLMLKLHSAISLYVYKFPTI